MQNRAIFKQTFIKIHEAYEKLFTNNDLNFTYNGLQSEKNKQKIIEMLDNAVTILEESSGGKYNIVNTIDTKKL